jgi:hypothetical protein
MAVNNHRAGFVPGGAACCEARSQTKKPELPGTNRQSSNPDKNPNA